MRHRSCWLSGLLLVLAVGGLLLMHGLDAPGHLIAARDHSQAPHAGDETAVGDLVAASAGAAVGPGTSHGTDHDGVLAHLMAMCVAVIAGAAGATALRRLWGRPVAVPVVTGAAARAWANRALDELRPPGPDRLALCILRI
jgi:hypothetical protein